ARGQALEESVNQNAAQKTSQNRGAAAAGRRKVRRIPAARKRESPSHQCRARGTRMAVCRVELRDKTKKTRTRLVAGAAASADDARMCRATTPRSPRVRTARGSNAGRIASAAQTIRRRV